MAEAWDRGERITAAEVLELHPEIDDEAAIRLIYEEACLRRDAGLDAETAEIVRRHPRWGEELQKLFDCDRLLRPSSADAIFPEAGDTLGPFRLLSELGRGAAGRTFLASDPTLADRPVIVKVIPDDQDEHLALARLRHTHIVPLFSEHTFPERGLRGLCMPDLGGSSLDHILEDLADTPVGRRSGKHLVDAIDRQAGNRPSAPTADGPFRHSLEQATYPQAITWIAACLADALQYAHERGLVHMDLKPSNVLIAVDGQPMLLDFHLARAPIPRGERVADRLGGTPGWMSPEQEAAMEAVAAGSPITVIVDGRTDIYAMGRLLQEALGLSPTTGRKQGRPPGVSVGLADIARKCLATSPADRYPEPAQLAEDLRRELNDLPLLGVRNRAPLELWRKWRRRHPSSFAWGIAGTAILVSAAIGLMTYSGHAGRLRNSLDDGRRYRLAGEYDEAIHTLGRGLQDAGMLPVAGDMRAALQRELGLAERGKLAVELHEVADQVRFRYGIDLPAREDAATLIRICSAIWDQKGRLLSSDGAKLDSASEQQIRSDLLEIAAVWIDLRIRLAPTDGSGEARSEALRHLDEAEGSFGASFALDLRREQLTAPTPPDAPTARKPRSAWEHCDLGRYYLRSGRIAAASIEFQRALDARPQDFWPNFYQGLCSFRLGRFDEAAAAFRTCIALAPEAAPCHYNRALALEALGQGPEALRDYSRAIDLDPGLAPALLNRGILLYSAGRNSEAIQDFERALRGRTDKETLGRLHYNLALAHLARGERHPARENAEKAAQLGIPEAKRIIDTTRDADPAQPPQPVNSGRSANQVR